jgi:DNA-binding beta-propeller fold protein YncE
MRFAALLTVALLGVAAAQAQAGERSPSRPSSPGTADARRIPEARAIRACAAAGPYWPTMTLALQGNTAWVACKEQSRLLRIGLARGRTTAKVRLDGPVIAVAIGFGSVWALDSSSRLYRLDPRTARVTKRIQVGAVAAYNIWIGGGSVWVADDQSARVLRVSPRTNRVIARIAVGNGPADMVFAPGRAWVVNHRDNSLSRIDLASNRASRLATVGGANAVAERLTLLGGSLWVTGRGVPLLQVDPETGATLRTIQIDGTGIDVVAAAGSLWVPVRTAAVDATGFPTMTALRRVTTTGTVTTVATARGRVDVHGLAAGRGAVWLSDTRDGFLYRIPT